MVSEQVFNFTKDLVKYAKRFFLIECKDGGVRKFELNTAQKYLHEQLERQKAEIGYVRAILIKGRQQGCTTYITARYYHKVIHGNGIKAFILSHEAQTTATIFSKVKMFQNSLDKEFSNFAPKVIASNNNRLIFSSDIGGGYTVGTAGNEEVGRGGTNQLLHLSEAAFYKNPEGIEKGLVQTVADEPGTEIIYETTANGQNFLYDKILAVRRDPDSDYQIIFIPWYWQEEYSVPDERMPTNYIPTEEEKGFKETYGLTDNQIVWRRRKIQAFKGDISSFKQEYPFTLEEAFEFSGDSLVRASDVVAARKSDKVSSYAPIVIGVDGARGGDRTVLLVRQGRKVIHYEAFFDMNIPRLYELIIQWLYKYNADMVFVDAAHGEGAVDLAKLAGFKNIISVYFQGGALNSNLYVNKRSEIMHAVRDWFSEGANIPDDDDFAKDVLSIPEAKKMPKLQIVAKEVIKKLLDGKSPDIMDALALTFAFPVAGVGGAGLVSRNTRRNTQKVSKIKTLNVKRGIRNHGTK